MNTTGVWLTGVLVAVLGTRSEAQEVFGYELTTDVVYGEGRVERDGQVVSIDLKMDLLRPRGRRE